VENESGGFRLEERNGTLRLVLHRPPLNILDIPMIRGIDKALRPCLSRRDLRILIIQSELEGIFSAGVDIKDHAPDRADEMLRAFHSLLLLLDELPQVTLAAVDGPCLGGALELALVCDLLLATPRSTFAQPEINVGCFPPAAAVLLPRFVGRYAYTMVLTGAAISAGEAARVGLVSQVVETLDAGVADCVASLNAKSGPVLAMARRALRQGAWGPLREALGRTERIYREGLSNTEDMEEGVRAFLEKREPRWTNR